MPILMILSIAALGVLFVNGSAKDQEEITEIDGITVTRHELDREMQRCRAVVINRIVNKHRITDMTDFWEKKYNGQTPVEILRQKALDTLMVFKVQERLLKERNLWPYSRYTELISDLEKTNDEREKAAKQGATIYGPVNYTERSFFDYKFGNAVIRLKEKLVEEGELVVDEEYLLQYFDELQATIYHQQEKFEDVRHYVRDAYIEKMYAVYIAEKAGKANIVLDESELIVSDVD